MPKDESTDVLLQSWRAGDRLAGDQLFRRYSRVLAAFFRRRAPAHVEDLVQRTLLACLHAASRFESRSSFRTYVFGIANNQFMMSLRRREVPTDTAHELATLHEDSPSQLVAMKQEQALLLAVLGKIEQKFLEVVRLYYWGGMSVEEIAQELDVPPGTIKSRLSRGRGAIRERLQNGEWLQLAHDANVRKFVEWARAED